MFPQCRLSCDIVVYMHTHIDGGAMIYQKLRKNTYFEGAFIGHQSEHTTTPKPIELQSGGIGFWAETVAARRDCRSVSPIPQKGPDEM